MGNGCTCCRRRRRRTRNGVRRRPTISEDIDDSDDAVVGNRAPGLILSGFFHPSVDALYGNNLLAFGPESHRLVLSYGFELPDAILDRIVSRTNDELGPRLVSYLTSYPHSVRTQGGREAEFSRLERLVVEPLLDRGELMIHEKEVEPDELVWARNLRFYLRCCVMMTEQVLLLPEHRRGVESLTSSSSSSSIGSLTTTTSSGSGSVPSSSPPVDGGGVSGSVSVSVSSGSTSSSIQYLPFNLGFLRYQVKVHTRAFGVESDDHDFFHEILLMDYFDDEDLEAEEQAAASGLSADSSLKHGSIFTSLETANGRSTMGSDQSVMTPLLAGFDETIMGSSPMSPSTPMVLSSYGSTTSGSAENITEFERALRRKESTGMMRGIGNIGVGVDDYRVRHLLQSFRRPCNLHEIRASQLKRLLKAFVQTKRLPIAFYVTRLNDLRLVQVPSSNKHLFQVSQEAVNALIGATARTWAPRAVREKLAKVAPLQIGVHWGLLVGEYCIEWTNSGLVSIKPMAKSWFISRCVGMFTVGGTGRTSVYDGDDDLDEFVLDGIESVDIDSLLDRSRRPSSVPHSVKEVDLIQLVCDLNSDVIRRWNYDVQYNKWNANCQHFFLALRNMVKQKFGRFIHEEENLRQILDAASRIAREEMHDLPYEEVDDMIPHPVGSLNSRAGDRESVDDQQGSRNFLQDSWSVSGFWRLAAFPFSEEFVAFVNHNNLRRSIRQMDETTAHEVFDTEFRNLLTAFHKSVIGDDDIPDVLALTEAFSDRFPHDYRFIKQFDRAMWGKELYCKLKFTDNVRRIRSSQVFGGRRRESRRVAMHRQRIQESLAENIRTFGVDVMYNIGRQERSKNLCPFGCPFEGKATLAGVASMAGINTVLRMVKRQFLT